MTGQFVDADSTYALFLISKTWVQEKTLQTKIFDMMPNLPTNWEDSKEFQS